MLLQTNSYIVPKDKRAEHARLLRRFRATLAKLGCDSFEVYEQVGSNWSTGEPTGRYVQIMRFRDRRHQIAVQAAERSDPAAQAIIAEFCQLINFPYQQQQGLFAVGFYHSVLPAAPARAQAAEPAAVGAAAPEDAADPGVAETDVVEEHPVEEGAEPAAETDHGAADQQLHDADATEHDVPEMPGNADEAGDIDADETGELLEAHADAEHPGAQPAADVEPSAEVESAPDDIPQELGALDIDLPDESDDHANSPERHVAR
jgi:hypothetical protein